jgi:3-methyladenine DNA glycosylase AlkC
MLIVCYAHVLVSMNNNHLTNVILNYSSKTEIDDMIRKPTNLLLTKTLKSALVELTAAESESQLNLSQAWTTMTSIELFIVRHSFEFLARTNLYEYVTS